jgi:alkaline phosphatase D
VFTQVAAQRPAFHLITGDLHYEDIAVDARDVFREAYGRVVSAPTQAALYRSVPVVYTWDDHDFGPNGSDRHSPSRTASHATYRELVPHHALASTDPQGPISQAFTVGRVRFLVLDCRSQRDRIDDPDVAGKTMLGAWQVEWLQRELLAAKGRFPLVFIVSSVSWVSNETERRDNWGRFTHERAALSDWMVDNGITGVCFLSGDAHMLAADDGTNNRYGVRGGPGFPALQAAPLDRGGSIKGGPWSVEPVLPGPGEGQFGVVDVTDTGSRIEVLFRGLNQDGAEKLRLAFAVP